MVKIHRKRLRTNSRKPTNPCGPSIALVVGRCSGNLVVDVFRADAESSPYRSSGNHRRGVKDPLLSEPGAGYSGQESECYVARVIETFIAADAAREPLLSNNAEGDGRNGGRKDSRRYADQDLSDDFSRFAGSPNYANTTQGHNGGSTDDQPLLALRPIHEPTGRTLRKD